MKFRLLLFSLISFAIQSCHSQSQKFESIEASAFADKIKAAQNPQILDVRTPEEFNSGHLDQAENANWNSGAFAEKTQKLDKSKPVFVYCLSGGRSKKAAAKLAESGFKNVYELEGGYLKWNAAGLSAPSDKLIGICPQEYNELLNTDKKVLVNFYADWCEPCKKMAPYMLALQKEMGEKIVVVRLNADEHKTMMKQLKIDALPALFLYENKQVIWQHSGYISEEDLKKQL